MPEKNRFTAGKSKQKNRIIWYAVFFIFLALKNIILHTLLVIIIINTMRWIGYPSPGPLSWLSDVFTEALEI